MTPQCLVTGASGFVGRVLCQRLQKLGVTVRALVRREISGPWDEAIISDITSQSWKVNPCREINTVYHLASKAHALTEVAQDEEEYWHVNTEATRKLLEAARNANVERFVFFSSVKATGESKGQLQNESCGSVPETAYGRSKLEAEKMVLQGGYVPHPVVIRPVMIYGQTRKGNLPRMIAAVAKGIFPPLPEVNNKRSMVHVGDVVQAAILAAEKLEASHQTYIVTDGQVYSTRQIYEWVCKAVGKPVSRITAPLGLMELLAQIGDGIGRIRGKRFLFDSDALEKLTGSAWYSCEKIQHELGFKAKYDLQKSLPEIVRHLGLSKA